MSATLKIAIVGLCAFAVRKADLNVPNETHVYLVRTKTGITEHLPRLIIPSRYVGNAKSVEFPAPDDVVAVHGDELLVWNLSAKLTIEPGDPLSKSRVRTQDVRKLDSVAPLERCAERAGKIKPELWDASSVAETPVVAWTALIGGRLTAGEKKKGHYHVPNHLEREFDSRFATHVDHAWDGDVESLEICLDAKRDEPCKRVIQIKGRKWIGSERVAMISNLPRSIPGDEQRAHFEMYFALSQYPPDDLCFTDAPPWVSYPEAPVPVRPLDKVHSEGGRRIFCPVGLMYYEP